MNERSHMGSAVGIAFLLVLFAGVGSASSVFWTISGGFGDGGSLSSSSFTFDADTSTLSNYSFNVSGGGFSAFDYTTGNSAPSVLSNHEFGAQDSVDGRSIIFQFTSSLTDAGGTVNLLLAGSSFEFCCAIDDRNFTSGSATSGQAPNTPEPRTSALIAIGMLLMTAIAIYRRGGFKRPLFVKRFDSR